MSGALGVSEELDTTLARCMDSSPRTCRFSDIESLLLSRIDTGECDFGRPTASVLNTSAKLVEEGLCWGTDGASSEDIRLMTVDGGYVRDWEVFLFIRVTQSA